MLRNPAQIERDVCLGQHFPVRAKQFGPNDHVPFAVRGLDERRVQFAVFVRRALEHIAAGYRSLITGIVADGQAHGFARGRFTIQVADGHSQGRLAGRKQVDGRGCQLDLGSCRLGHFDGRLGRQPAFGQRAYGGRAGIVPGGEQDRQTAVIVSTGRQGIRSPGHGDLAVEWSGDAGELAQAVV